MKDLYSAGVQAFFVGGRRFDLCEVFVGEHESNTFKLWCECSNLLGMSDNDSHREALLPDGWYRVIWDDHFEAWIPDGKIQKPIKEPYIEEAEFC